MKKTIFCLLPLCLIAASAHCAAPVFFHLNRDGMVDTREDIRKNPASPYRTAYDKLIANAATLLKTPAEKVTDGDVPPTGNVHDFFAIGRLAWPNPDTPDGMPWVRRDGKTNPAADSDKYDLKRYNQTLDRINTLTLAWFYTGEESYAVRAAELLRVWFLDPETRMNPNFECASALPGVYNGMPIGIIFGVVMINLVDHVKLLAESGCWPESDDKALQEWFRDYCTWLFESELGKKEGVATNNHGGWYAAQVAAFSIYNGDLDRARSMVELAKKQIGDQIDADGSMPRETRRVRSMNYSIYGLQALATVANLSKFLGEDLWNYRSPDGRSIHMAMEWLAPRLTGEIEWPFPDMDNGKVKPAAYNMVAQAAREYDSDAFTRAAKVLRSSGSSASPRIWLMGE